MMNNWSIIGKREVQNILILIMRCSNNPDSTWIGTEAVPSLIMKVTSKKGQVKDPNSSDLEKHKGKGLPLLDLSGKECFWTTLEVNTLAEKDDFLELIILYEQH